MTVPVGTLGCEYVEVACTLLDDALLWAEASETTLRSAVRVFMVKVGVMALHKLIPVVRKSKTLLDSIHVIYCRP